MSQAITATTESPPPPHRSLLGNDRMTSHSYKAHFHSAVAAAVGTAVIHAAHLAITEWTNRTKRPGKPSANWPWRVTLSMFVVLAFTLIIFCAVKESDVGVTILDAVSVAHVVVVEVRLPMPSTYTTLLVVCKKTKTKLTSHRP